MRQRPDSCIGCACYSMGTDFSAVEGTGSIGTMLVGEASGEMEARDQLPFRPYAPAGAVLTRILRRMGYSREMFAITNQIRCRPRNNFLDGAPWEFSALNHCRPNLDAAIAAYRPRAIVALGGIALRELTGMAGEQRGISHLSGYVLPCTARTHTDDGRYLHRDGVIPVIGTFHPAFLRRGKSSYQGIVARHIHRAVRIAAGQDHDYTWNIDPESPLALKELHYATHPGLDDVLSFSRYVLGHPQLALSYDLETAESSSLDEDAREGFVDTYIRLVQFAIDGAGAIAIPWEPEFKAAICQLLRSPNTKCGHNVWLFDNKVIRATAEREGLDMAIGGTVHDTLQMFHHWQPDLIAHLQAAAQFVGFPFPWKHLAGTNMEFYGCCDVDATLRLYTFLEGALRREGLWGDEVAA